MRVWLRLGSCLALSSLLLACEDRGYLTPPPQATGATLNSRAADQHPRLSYSGRYLVFASDRGNQRRILVYDLQRRQLVPLPGLNQPGVFHDQPDISADGRYIVYVSEQSGKPDIFVYDRQTFTAEPIARELVGEVRQPTISGDGRFVAFESNRSGQWNIEIYDRGAGIERSLPPGAAPRLESEPP